MIPVAKVNVIKHLHQFRYRNEMKPTQSSLTRLMTGKVITVKLVPHEPA